MTETIDVDRSALMFVGIVCEGRAQANHIMGIVSRVKKDGGVATLPRTQSDGLLALAERGLRTTKNHTPVAALFDVGEQHTKLTNLGCTLLKEFTDGEDI